MMTARNSTILTDPNGLQSLLGSFWSGTYDGQDQVFSVCATLAEFAKQLAIDTEQVQRSLSYRDIAPYRRERWYPLTLNSADMNTTEGSLLRFGAGAVFGPQPGGIIYQYGVSPAFYFAFPAPNNLKSWQLMTSRIGSPGAALTEGIDVRLDQANHVFLFAVNPFLNPNLAIQTVTDGDSTFQTLTLWLSDACFDHGDVYTQAGYVFGMDPNQDSLLQKRGLLAIAESVVGGTTLDSLYRLLTAGTGIARSAGDQVVEVLLQDRNGQAIITDQCVYRVPADAAVSWVVGDTIPDGAFVTDDVQIQDFRQGSVPDWLVALTLTPGTLAAPINGSLIFTNALVALERTYDTGQEVTRFPLGGNPQVVDRFFSILDQRLRVAGLRLAALTNAAGEPPGQINPLRFLIANWLRGSLCVIRLTSVALRDPGNENLRWLRRLSPPHTLLIVIVTLQPPPTYCIMSPPVVSHLPNLTAVIANCQLGPLTVSIRG